MRIRVLPLLAVALALTAEAAAEDGSRRSKHLESEASLSSISVKTYVQETGLDADEARLALAREELAIPHINELRAEFAERLAGLYWIRLPEQHIVVRLTGNDQVQPRKIQTEAGIVPVVFMAGAAATTAQLVDRLRAAGPGLRSAVPDLVGAWVDETTGKVVLDVATSTESERAYDTGRGAVERSMGFPVEFRLVSPPHDLNFS